MVQSHHVPSTDLARLIIILAGSMLTLSSQTSPRVHVPGPAALATQCCAYTKKADAEPVLVLLHLEELPSALKSCWPLPLCKSFLLLVCCYAGLCPDRV